MWLQVGSWSKTNVAITSSFLLHITLTDIGNTKGTNYVVSNMYNSFVDEHIANYQVYPPPALLKSIEVTFHTTLNVIATKHSNCTQFILHNGRCSAHTPSNLHFLPKDHKAPLNWRLIVGALDTPSTSLCKVLRYVFKPVLLRVASHLLDTRCWMLWIAVLSYVSGLS